MYPKDNPRFIFYLYLDSPRIDNKADMLKSILTDIETYYNITKVKTDSKKIYIMENFLNKNIETVKSNLDSRSIKYEIIGNGQKVVNQYPKKGTTLNGKVFLLTNDDNKNIPNIVSYSRKDAINLMKLLNLEYTIEGNGYVSEYSVETDANLKPIKVNMKLNDKYQE